MMRSVSLQAQIFTELDVIAGIKDEWTDLFERCPGATTFQRPEWVLGWMETFRPSRPWLVAVWQESRLVGLAPLLIYAKNSQRVLAFMAGGVSDYLDFLVDPSFTDQAIATIFEEIEGHPDLWDQVELTDIPQSSSLLAASSSRNYDVQPHDSCLVLGLPRALDDLNTVVPPHKLRNFRNARRRISKSGDFRVELASFTNCDEAFSNLFRLHTERWNDTGQTGVLSEHGVQDFHLHVSCELLSKGILRLYMVYLQELCIATLYSFFESDIVYCYLQGFDPEYSKLSPGTFILGTVIEDAIRHRAGKIDFLRGCEPYKESWGAKAVSSFRVQKSLPNF